MWGTKTKSTNIKVLSLPFICVLRLASLGLFYLLATSTFLCELGNLLIMRLLHQSSYARKYHGGYLKRELAQVLKLNKHKLS